MSKQMGLKMIDRWRTFQRPVVALLNGVGICWGIALFVIGAIDSFTLNSIHFWSNVLVLFTCCLLPFPIAGMAIWFPRFSGVLLLICAAITAGVGLVLFGLHGIVEAVGKGLIISHCVFGLAYIAIGQVQQSIDENAKSEASH